MTRFVKWAHHRFAKSWELHYLCIVWPLQTGPSAKYFAKSLCCTTVFLDISMLGPALRWWFITMMCQDRASSGHSAILVSLQSPSSLSIDAHRWEATTYDIGSDISSNAPSVRQFPSVCYFINFCYFIHTAQQLVHFRNESFRASNIVLCQVHSHEHHKTLD